MKNYLSSKKRIKTMAYILGLRLCDLIINLKAIKLIFKVCTVILLSVSIMALSVPDAKAYVEFGPNWQQWEKVPLNSKQVETLLKTTSGALGSEVNSSSSKVRVISGAHQNPLGPNRDTKLHLTIALVDRRPQKTCHVYLGIKNNTYKIVNTECR